MISETLDPEMVRSQPDSQESLTLDPGDGSGEGIAFRWQAVPEPRRGEAAILYLHGFGSTQDGEKAQAFRSLAHTAGLPFASIDFRGHGDSGGSMDDLTLSRNLADVARAAQEVRRRGFSKILLLGSSLGGLTGLWYAAFHPEEITAGLHIAPAVDLAERARTWFGSKGLEVWRRQGFQRVETDLVSIDLGYGFIEDLEAHTLERLLTLYRTPTLLIQGKHDTSVAWRRVLDFAAECPYEGIELHLFSDGDHRLLDRKERVWGLMEAFLEGELLTGTS